MTKRQLSMTAGLILGVAFLPGCGGSETDSYKTVASPAVFLGRSYSGTVLIDAGRTASVGVAVASNGAATGTFAVNTRGHAISAGRAVVSTGTATGTVDLKTGVFNLTGTDNANGAKPFTLSGVLPSAANSGDFSLTFGGTTFSGSLAALGSTPSPTPSVTPSSSPSPSVSPSPTVSPSPSVTPSPTPSPTAVPGTSAIAKYFPLHPGDTYRYKHSSSEDPNNSLGRPDELIRISSPVTFAGKAAYHLEEIDPVTGAVKSGDYEYVNNTSEGYTTYGYNLGSIQAPFDPAFVITAGVLNGQVIDFSYNETSDGGSTYRNTGTMTRLEPVTISVPAGVFTVVKILVRTSYNYTNSSGQTSTDIEEKTLYLAENVGVVRITYHDVNPNGTTTSDSISELKSATIAGKQYP